MHAAETAAERQMSKAAKGAEQALFALKMLNRFGWLRVVDLEKLIWPQSLAGDQLARRLVTRLLEKGLVIESKLEGGIRIFMLSARGASRLVEEGIDADSGKDLSPQSGYAKHRILCNEYAIHQLNKGYDILTEREILSRKSPVTKIYEKVPDVLVQLRENWAWCEVERAYKKKSDYDKLIRFICLACPDGRSRYLELNKSKQLYLDRVVMVADDMRHFDRLCRELNQRQRNNQLFGIETRHWADDYLEWAYRQPDGAFQEGFFMYDRQNGEIVMVH